MTYRTLSGSHCTLLASKGPESCPENTQGLFNNASKQESKNAKSFKTLCVGQAAEASIVSVVWMIVPCYKSRL
jgi:hypothetical protein